MIGVIVTSYNRPEALARSLPQISALGAPILVIDDGSDPARAATLADVAALVGARVCRLPENRGLAAALNVGLAYWLADRRAEWISYFQDDVDVSPSLFAELERAAAEYPAELYTGHDSPKHAGLPAPEGVKFKLSAAGLHLHARAHFWASIMPIPTYELGAPHRREGRPGRGVGSNVDWWITRDAPARMVQGGYIVCVPGLVRTFLHRAADSTWGNGVAADPPLRVQ